MNAHGYYDHDVLHLSAADLWSKHGFSDGDQVLEFVYRHDLDSELKLVKGSEQHSGNKAVLVKLVRQYLLPALPRPVDVYEIGTIHNPIRVEESEGISPPSDIRNVEVKVTKEQVLAALKELQ